MNWKKLYRREYYPSIRIYTCTMYVHIVIHYYKQLEPSFQPTICSVYNTRRYNIPNQHTYFAHVATNRPNETNIILGDLVCLFKTHIEMVRSYNTTYRNDIMLSVSLCSDFILFCFGVENFYKMLLKVKYTTVRSVHIYIWGLYIQ